MDYHLETRKFPMYIWKSVIIKLSINSSNLSLHHLFLTRIHMNSELQRIYQHTVSNSSKFSMSFPTVPGNYWLRLSGNPGFRTGETIARIFFITNETSKFPIQSENASKLILLIASINTWCIFPIMDFHFFTWLSPIGNYSFYSKKLVCVSPTLQTYLS